MKYRLTVCITTGGTYYVPEMKHAWWPFWCTVKDAYLGAGECGPWWSSNRHRAEAVIWAHKHKKMVTAARKGYHIDV